MNFSFVYLVFKLVTKCTFSIVLNTKPIPYCHFSSTTKQQMMLWQKTVHIAPKRQYMFYQNGPRF